MILVFITT